MFSSHFCFQVIVILLVIALLVSFLMAVIDPPSFFLCSPRVVLSMRKHCLQCWNVLFLPPYTYSLWTSSLGCYAFCMIISFLVLWSICLCSSLVHFKKSPEYLTRGTAQVFIPLIRFLLDSFVSSSLLVLLRNSFLIFSFISTCLMVSASKIPKYL